MNNSNLDISVVIPSFENFDIFVKSFDSVINQKLKPKQIVIIDSSKSNKINDFISIQKLTYKYIDITYYHQNNLYPGKARNLGVNKSKYYWIAFLDSKTLADTHWLSDYANIISKNDYDVIFGSTKFITENDKKISKLFLYSTFGNKTHITVPGTLIKKDYFTQNQFLENFRAGEDVLWKKQIEDNFLIKKLIIKKPYILYNQISNNFFENIYKHFVYSIPSSIISIKNNIKDIYLSFFLILTALIVPKWNVLIGGWDSNPLYVPNITKLYILSLCFILIIFLFFKNIFIKSNFLRESIILKIIFFILFIFFSIFVFKWNSEYSLRYYNVIFKIPHITKFYLFLVILLSIVFRGLYIPIKNKVSVSEIKYFQWFKIGLVGFFIDIVKSPAFIFGAFFSILKLNFFFNFKDINKKKKNILFICPFPYDVQAGQRLKYEQHLKYFYLQGYDITLSPFINLSTWKIIYTKGNNLKKAFALLKGYSMRFINLFTLRKYEIVYIFMWVVPYTSNYMEYVYRKISKKIIYDMEDNILIASKNEINPVTSSFKSTLKYKFLIKYSNKVIVSSKYLEDWCNQYTGNNNAKYICASINTDRYTLTKHYSKKTINIGWTGTFSTKKYLKIIEPIIKKIALIRSIKFIVIGDFSYDLDGVNVENIIWNKESEIQDLNKIDIGVYPLSDDDWVLGKSGLKALQYMALGIPSISSNYGNIKKIIKNNFNGFLVNNNDEWYSTLMNLCDDVDLRKFIGNNARIHIDNFYSVKKISNQYLNVIKNL